MGNQAIIQRLGQWVTTGYAPQAVVIFGVPGVGKTSAVRAFIREYLAERLRALGGPTELTPVFLDSSLLEVDGIKMWGTPIITLSGDVINFLRSAGLCSTGIKKFVLFDDTSALIRKAQRALLPIIEKYGNSNCMIFVDNDIKRLEPALVSRAAGARFHFETVTPDEMLPYLVKVGRAERMNFVDLPAECRRAAEESGGIVREAVGLLQERWQDSRIGIQRADR